MLLLLGGRIPLAGSWEPLVLPALPWKVGTIGLPLLFFFIVFFGNASYGRFYQLYSHCVGIGGATMEWVALVKTSTKHIAEPERVAAQWHAVRLILAAQHLLYYSLYGDGVQDAEWRMIAKRGLLTAREVQTLKQYGGMKPFLAVCWALDYVTAVITRDANIVLSQRDTAKAVATEVLLMQFREIIFKFRGHCGQIINLLKQPVPFPYFHLLNFILVLQLLLIAYALACDPSLDALPPYFALLLLVFISIVLIGMRGLAVQLSNPFGTDAVDFELETFMRGAYKNAVAHLRSSELNVGDGCEPCKEFPNPLLPHLEDAEQQNIDLPWSQTPEDAGVIRDDDRVLPAGFTQAITNTINRTFVPTQDYPPLAEQSTKLDLEAPPKNESSTGHSTRKSQLRQALTHAASMKGQSITCDTDAMNRSAGESSQGRASNSTATGDQPVHWM
jgi:predicted membrane chloride channel (bestrophin family)